MTIITKPLSEKKGDKLVVPLVDDDHLASANALPADAEAQTRNVVLLRARARRVSTSTTLCLLLTALLVVSVGILGGTYLYRQYLQAQMRRFRASAEIPYPVFYRLSGDTDVNDKGLEKWSNSFQEEFDIDVKNEDYEKIDVPDFRDGRSGRFVHDFNTNITGIIDVTGNRCFIMPLNRDNVLPPKSLLDLVHKMWDGYYKVDTEIVRETMHVVTPPITDTKNIGEYITKECGDRPIYKLEKYVGGVVKRSAELHSEAKFAQFAGKGITEIDIVNFDELKAFEEKNH